MDREPIGTASEIFRQSFLRKVYTALTLFVLAILVGIVGFILIEDYSFVEALYMTVITISTVGFTEVKPLTDTGRLFTSILILSNIGILAYLVSILTSILMEGEFRELFKSYRLRRMIKELEDHVVVCGYGRLGRQVIEELELEGRQYIVIESNADVTDDIESTKGQFFMTGDATKEETLIGAHLESAAALITTLPGDAANVFVVLSARQINPELTIISRAALETSVSKIKHAGADHVIMPEHLGGAHMAKLITKPDLVEFLNEVSGQSGVNIYFEECLIETLPAEMQHKSIRELDVKKMTGANIIGIRNPDGSFTINPDADCKIPIKSKLILLGTKQQIDQFNRMMNNGKVRSS